jgi:hypothetical protein
MEGEKILNRQQLILMAPDELERLATGLRQQIADGVASLKSHLIERPLTRREAADYLGIGLTALDNRIKRGDIPRKLVHKNGGTPYFFASELEQLLKKS